MSSNQSKSRGVPIQIPVARTELMENQNNEEPSEGADDLKKLEEDVEIAAIRAGKFELNLNENGTLQQDVHSSFASPSLSSRIETMNPTSKRCGSFIICEFFK